MVHDFGRPTPPRPGKKEPTRTVKVRYAEGNILAVLALLADGWVLDRPQDFQLKKSPSRFTGDDSYCLVKSPENVVLTNRNIVVNPVEDWKWTGYLIDKHDISVQCYDGSGPKERRWNAYVVGQLPYNKAEEIVGPTPQIAVCRAIAVYLLGEKVELPEVLFK